MSIEEEGVKIEQKPIEISSEEYEKYCGLELNDPEMSNWLAQKGIKVDSGLVDILLDGKRRKMTTSSNDFGTIEAVITKHS